jgi:hypothetical protein
MTTRRQFLSLVRVLLGIARFGPIPLFLWFGLMTSVLYAVSIFSSEVWLRLGPQGNTWQDFIGAQIAADGALYIFLLVFSTPIMLEFTSGMPAGALIEFFFTRAMDRSIFVRNERVAQLVILIGPLLLNLAISPFAPEFDFGSEGIHLAHEPVRFAAWLVWAGVLCIYLVVAYQVFSARRIQKLAVDRVAAKRGVWMVFVAAYAPALVICAGVAICASMRINLYGGCFWLYERHPARCRGRACWHWFAWCNR